jgi:RNA polymerase sigma-70 factor (ECF subfamily)
MSTDVHRTIEAIGRIESPRLVAATARIVRDLGVAEEIVQDALLTALETWPAQGIPASPRGWLMATARHRAIDHIRRVTMMERKQYQLVRDHELEQQLTGEVLLDEASDDYGDDLLRLLFVCCHPVLAQPARVALTLRLIGALTTTEIASAFLVKEATVAQRIARAKRTLAQAGVAFDAPAGDELVARLPAVLEVIYLVFNEGYTASGGERWVRPQLCEDALRLGRMLTKLLRDESEVHGLVALMEFQASRLRARVGAGGEPVRRAQDTDWARIAALYAELLDWVPSPVIELNRAVAVGMAYGPQSALEIVDRLIEAPALAAYHLLPSVRADLLAQLGRIDEARSELERAAALAGNAAARSLIARRASLLAAN